LQVLREHQLYAKLRKCSFYQNKIHYLGHIISEEGITVDLEKIEAIKGWKTPKNMTKVKILYGSSWLLQKVHCMVFENISPNHFLAKKRGKVSMHKIM
jgi:hypothetical protein